LRYVIVYDISDDNKRFKVARALEPVLISLVRGVLVFIIICSAHVHWFLRPLNAMRYAFIFVCLYIYW
jgi:hypothetical protein